MDDEGTMLEPHTLAVCDLASCHRGTSLFSKEFRRKAGDFGALEAFLGPISEPHATGDSRTTRSSGQPVDSDFLIHRLELGVAGDEVGLQLLGQRGGKGVGETQAEARLEIRGRVGQLAVGGVEFNG